MRYVFVILCFFVIATSVFLALQMDRLPERANDANLNSSFLTSKPFVAVVPHHDIVKEKRREFLAQISLEAQPETIILVSPNHFGVGRKPVVTTDYTWQLQGGTEQVNVDELLVRRLFEEEIVEKNTDGVRGDHGITNLLRDVHEFFPKSRVVPILLRDTITTIEVERFARDMYEGCKEQCGIIASVDMSHYQTARAADIHDVKTIRALEMLDDDAVWNAEVDSRASLAFLLDWAKRFSLSRFHLVSHTNSGELVGNFENETTTHIMGYYESGVPNPVNSNITFAIAGGVSDCSGDRFGISQLSDFGARALWGADTSWVFWNMKKENFPARDQLVRGWHWSELLGQEDVSTMREEVSVSRYERGNHQVVFVSADAGNVSLEKTIRQEKKEETFVIVLPRWTERYGVQHSHEQYERAVSWVRAGARIVVGFHEGGLQDMEVIDGVPVFYSVGDFLSGCEETNSLVINGVIEDERLRLVFDPVWAEDFDAKLVSGNDRVKIFQRLCLSGVSECSDGYMEVQRMP